MNTKFTISLYFFLCLSVMAQSQHSFIDTLNTWYIDDCWYSNAFLGTYCSTFEYRFDPNTEKIDGKKYYRLITDNPDTSSMPYFFGKYYRQEEDRVYMKFDAESETYLIYDFGLSVGDQMLIGEGSNYSFLVEVSAIDFIQIDNGEMRKRLEVFRVNYPDLIAFWVEGIGSDLAPMNTQYMFSLDTWVEFNCHRTGEEINYVLGDCELGIDGPNSTEDLLFPEYEVQLFPNPVSEILHIRHQYALPVVRLKLLDSAGNIALVANTSTTKLDVSLLASGIYSLEVLYHDGKRSIAKIVVD